MRASRVDVSASGFGAPGALDPARPTKGSSLLEAIDVAPNPVDASAHVLGASEHALVADPHRRSSVTTPRTVVSDPNAAAASVHPNESFRDRAHERACLLVGSPREVLARIVPGDPLDVRDAVADALRAECVFLDADRVHLRALARIARAAPRFATSRIDLAALLRGEVASAIAELLREEVEAPRAETASAFEQFARPLGLDPDGVRRGCAAFNRLPLADRAAFCALVVRGVGLEALARETGEPPSELGRRARRGLEAVLHASHPELPPPVRSPSSSEPSSNERLSKPASSRGTAANATTDGPAARPGRAAPAAAHGSRSKETSC